MAIISALLEAGFTARPLVRRALGTLAFGRFALGRFALGRFALGTFALGTFALGCRDASRDFEGEGSRDFEAETSAVQATEVGAEGAIASGNDGNRESGSRESGSGNDGAGENAAPSGGAVAGNGDDERLEGELPRADGSDSNGEASGDSSGEANGPDGTAPGEASGVAIVGRRLVVDGRPFFMRGVCWNPVARGDVHPQGLDFSGFAERDVPLMRALGVNVVRTYEPLLEEAVLDRLHEAGIYVLNSIYPYGGAPAEEAVARVRAVASHPANLIWLVGNEWNYNGLYVGLSHREALERVAEVSRLVRAEDPTRPVATVYGELPSAETLEALPEIDVWGINSYRGISFGGLFDDWASLSGAPMFLAEYGADSYDATAGRYAPDRQMEAVTALTRELVERASAFEPSGVTLGGSLFEWADEWWKDDAGSPAVQDVGGIAPGGGPYPDSVFNEEWWGLVDIDRNPRPAYAALSAIFASLDANP